MRARLDSLPKTEASFIEPMECLSVSKLPGGDQWIWEIKLDGYRALAVRPGTGVTLFSRRRKSLNRQFPYIVEALTDLPEGTVVELLPLDPGDWLDENDRAALHQALKDSEEDVEAGRLVDADVILRERRSR